VCVTREGAVWTWGSYRKNSGDGTQLDGPQSLRPICVPGLRGQRVEICAANGHMTAVLDTEGKAYLYGPGIADWAVHAPKAMSLVAGAATAADPLGCAVWEVHPNDLPPWVNMAHHIHNIPVLRLHITVSSVQAGVTLG
jgi:hypothetical protein